MAWELLMPATGQGRCRWKLRRPCERWDGPLVWTKTASARAFGCGARVRMSTIAYSCLRPVYDLSTTLEIGRRHILAHRYYISTTYVMSTTQVHMLYT